MRTTINIDVALLEKFEDAMKRLRLSKNELLSLLLARIIRENEFEPRPHERVRYQERSKGLIIWKKEPITLESVFYEKYLDLRRNCKFSVSWFIAYAIKNYLDELIFDLSNSEVAKEDADNYVRNFVYCAKMIGTIPLYISVFGVPEMKYLERLLNINE
jgi:hypothetical protein